MDAPLRRRARPSVRVAGVPGLILLLVVGLVGVAAAYWTQSGIGSGAAVASVAPSPLTLGPATPTAQLFPGGAAGVVLVATNPNVETLRIGTLALDATQGTGGFAVDVAHAGCPLAALGFTTQSNGGSGWTVPGSGSQSISLPASLTMASSADNACQGARFTVYLKATS